jgi:hypothetical protein
MLELTRVALLITIFLAASLRASVNIKLTYCNEAFYIYGQPFSVTEVVSGMKRLIEYDSAYVGIYTREDREALCVGCLTLKIKTLPKRVLQRTQRRLIRNPDPSVELRPGGRAIRLSTDFSLNKPDTISAQLIGGANHLIAARRLSNLGIRINLEDFRPIVLPKVVIKAILTAYDLDEQEVHHMLELFYSGRDVVGYTPDFPFTRFNPNSETQRIVYGFLSLLERGNHDGKSIFFIACDAGRMEERGMAQLLESRIEEHNEMQLMLREAVQSFDPESQTERGSNETDSDPSDYI